MPELVYCVNDLSDPVFRGQIGELLRDIFDLDIKVLGDLGVWPTDYRAFSYVGEGAIAANVSCLPLPLVIGGEAVLAGGIQTAATRPTYRGRGLFRDLMQRVIAYGEDRFACLLLYTDMPALYRPFGFRRLDTHSFLGRLSMAEPAPSKSAMRRLSLDARADVKVMRSLFSRREAASHHLGPRGGEASFFLNASWYRNWRLTFLPDDDALVVSDLQDGRLRLLDIVCSRLPATERLAAALEVTDEELHVLFPPDRLQGTFAPVPHFDPDAGRLMVRGRFGIEGSAFLLPPTAWF